jgi:hypothetical protein
VLLREIILKLDSVACEVVRLGEKSATYGLGPKKMSEAYAYILPNKNWVNLGFYKGVLLADKGHVLEGSGKSMRHVKIYSIDDANRPEVKTLLKLALDERKKALNRG